MFDWDTHGPDLVPVCLGVTNLEGTRGWGLPVDARAGDAIQVGPDESIVLFEHNGRLYAKPVELTESE